jgi:hypothetical protein
MEKPLSELSLEELQKKEKTHKYSMPVLAGVLIVLAASSIFITFQKGFNIFTTIPLAFLPVYVALASNLKKIKAEISLRTKK